MHEKAKSVCFIYKQPQKVKFKFVQINMKQVSYYKDTNAFAKMFGIAFFIGAHIIFALRFYCIEFLTLKAPITTAADDKFCEIFPNFRQK